MYYYTSTDTMSKVLTGANLFATNLGYMNDAHEYIHGLKTVKKVLEDKGIPSSENFLDSNIDEVINNRKELTYFSISFCKDGDLLSQWTTYARESGVSIEMDFGKEEDDTDVDFKIESYSEDKIVISACPKEIIYIASNWENIQDEQDNVWRLLENEGKRGLKESDYFRDAGRRISAYVKQQDFVQEREFRLVFDIAAMGEEPKICYRVDKHVIKPYLSVECVDGWPVTAITVGPGFNQEIVYQSVKYFLNHAKIKSRKLCKKGQWKMQIEAYFKEGRKELQEMWGRMLDQDSDFIMEWRKLEDSPDEDLYESHKRTWAKRVEKAIKSELRKLVDDVSILQEKYREYVGSYCFTISGIIVRKSEIPYIY